MSRFPAPRLPSGDPDPRSPAEQQLQAFRDALDQHAIVAITDARGRITFVNDKFCSISQYAREELLGQDHRILNSSLHSKAFFRTLWQTILSGKVWQGQIRNRAKDGSLYWLDTTIVPFMGADGEPIEFIAIRKEITEQKRVEEALRASLEQLRDLREALDHHAIVAVTDAKGRITFVNDKFCSISQYAREELLGQDHRVLNSGLHPKSFIRDLWQTILSGKVWQGQLRNRAKDGSLYWLDTTIVPFMGADGEPVEFIAIRKEITEQKRAEEALRASLEHQARLMESARLVRAACWFMEDGRLVFTDSIHDILGDGSSPQGLDQEALLERVHPEAREAFRHALTARGPRLRAFDCQIRRADGTWVWTRWSLAQDPTLGGVVQDIDEERKLQAQLVQSQKMESLGTLAAGVAHDLRNILQAISGHDDLLARSLAGDPKAMKHLEAIHQAVDRAQALTRKLLAFSRDEPPQKSLVEPLLLIEEVSGLLRPSLGRNTRLGTEVEPRLTRTLMDPHQIHQILVNLVLNAQAAIGAEGAIVIRGKQMELAEGSPELGDHPEGAYLVFEVSDNGSGISPEVLPRIFEPFFTTKGEKGTGLGLSVAYGIAKAHGGWMACDSKPGRGTQFRLYLPSEAAGSNEPSGSHRAYAS